MAWLALVFRATSQTRSFVDCGSPSRCDSHRDRGSARTGNPRDSADNDLPVRGSRSLRYARDSNPTCACRPAFANSDRGAVGVARSGDPCRCISGLGSPAATRRLASISSSERCCLGHERLALDNVNPLGVVPGRIGALRSRTPRRRRTARRRPCRNGCDVLLGQRLAYWFAAEGVRPWVAGALAAVAVTSLTIALQAANLENDVWLAAFWLESLWASQFEPQALGRSLAVTALIKPYGFLYAGVAAAVTRAPFRSWLIGFAPLTFWLIRDAVLMPTATFQLKTTSEGRALDGGFTTSIAAHGADGVLGLGRALVQDGPSTIILFVAALSGIFVAKPITIRLAIICAFAVFVLQPLGFTHIGEPFGTDTALRYGLPFLVAGALTLTPLARKAPLTCGIIAVLSAAYGAMRIVRVFMNDAMTHGTWWIVVLTALVILATPSRLRSRAAGLLAMGIAAYAIVLAGSHTSGYYDDWLDGSTQQTKLFEWIARRKPSAVVGSHFRVGAINVVSPETHVADALPNDACEESERLHALLVLANDESGNTIDLVAGPYARQSLRRHTLQRPVVRRRCAAVTRPGRGRSGLVEQAPAPKPLPAFRRLHQYKRCEEGKRTGWLPRRRRPCRTAGR